MKPPKIDAEFSEPNLSQDYYTRLLSFIEQIEADWRHSGNFYLADRAAHLAEGMRVYRQENSQFIPAIRTQTTEK